MFASIVEIIQEHLKEKEVNVHFVDEEVDEVLYAQTIANERCPLGIIFLGGLPHNFKEHFHTIDVPSVLVTLDASEFGFPNLSSVCLDDKVAAKHAMKLLIENGHRNIGIIAADGKVSGPAAQRFLGVNEALKGIGLTCRAENCEISKFSAGSGYKATLRLLNKSPDITAIFCMADVMAMGALRAIYDSGKRVPQDISLIGFDGLDMTHYCVPRISTVKQDVEMLATESVKILDDAITKKEHAKHYRIPYTLQEGESIRNINV